MAIARISGNILQDNLQRGSNLSIQGNLLYIDVTNDRVGVGTSSPDVEFTVVGSANISANVDAGNAIVSGSVSATGNVTGGNLTTGGDVTTATVTATGNVSGGNLVSSADVTTVSVTASGNVSGGNLVSSADVTTATVTATGNVSGGNITTGGDVTTSTVTASSTITATGNVSGGNITTSGAVEATGNVSGGNLISSGSVETANITLSGTTVTSDANLSIATSSNGNVDFDVDGTGVVSFNTSTSLTLPSGNTAQRPGSPETGALRFNTSVSQVEIYDGAAWDSITGGAFANITSQELTGDGSTVQFTLDRTTTAAAIIVSTNGVVQLPDTAYTVTGNQITFAEAPVSSDTVDVRFNSIVTTVSSITNTSGANSITVQTNGVADLTTTQSVQLPSYTTTQAANLANTANGQVIYVTDGDGGSPCLAVYSVDNWKRVALGANIAGS